MSKDLFRPIDNNSLLSESLLTLPLTQGPLTIALHYSKWDKWGYLANICIVSFCAGIFTCIAPACQELFGEFSIFPSTIQKSKGWLGIEGIGVGGVGELGRRSIWTSVCTTIRISCYQPRIIWWVFFSYRRDWLATI